MTIMVFISMMFQNLTTRTLVVRESVTYCISFFHVGLSNQENLPSTHIPVLEVQREVWFAFPT